MNEMVLASLPELSAEWHDEILASPTELTAASNHDLVLASLQELTVSRDPDLAAE